MVPDGLIAALTPLECYKYLGIYEATVPKPKK